MPDYSKGKIYKIVSDDPNITDVYIGSTTSTLSKRFVCHKSKFINKTGYCSSQKLFALYGVELFHIELIENYPCKNITELRIREQHHLDTTECINEARAYTSKEQRTANKKYYGEQFRKLFPEKKALKNKLYQQEHPEQYKAYQHQYRQEHEEELKAYFKARYEQKKNTEVICECGCVSNLQNIKRHRKSKKHAELMANLHLE